MLPISQLSISENGKILGFSSDSGSIGVVDLATLTVTRMKSRHNTVNLHRGTRRLLSSSSHSTGLRIRQIHSRSSKRDGQWGI